MEQLGFVIIESCVPSSEDNMAERVSWRRMPTSIDFVYTCELLDIVFVVNPPQRALAFSFNQLLVSRNFCCSYHM